MILCAVGVLGFLLIRSRPLISGHSFQYLISGAGGVPAASISFSTVLLLLAVGIAGALGVSRKKKDNVGSSHDHTTHQKSNDRDKAFVNLNKQYLNLQYQMTHHQICGDDPPDDLREEISDIERKVKLIARALE